ncbi:MAG: N-6 DNA methylase [Planctomycetota bacterium]
MNAHAERVLALAGERIGDAAHGASLRELIARAELDLLNEVSPGVAAGAHEALLESVPVLREGALAVEARPANDRRNAGVFYTPPAIARHLTEVALGSIDTDRPRVCDPAAGAGVFLSEASGLRPHAELHGVEMDPVAAAIAERAVPGAMIRVGDAFAHYWTEHFDVLLGNPPFKNQLKSRTANERALAAALSDRSNGVVRGYADLAAAFLHHALEITRPGGVVAMVMPMSLLASRDTRPLRELIDREYALEHLWVSRERAFGDRVRVCGVVIRKGGRRGPMITRSAGLKPESAAPIERDDDPATWGPRVSDLWGVPRVSLQSERTLAEIAEVTADFRDEYYAVARALREHEAGDAPVITSGLIDPADCAWDERSTKIDKRSWTRPAVDPNALGGKAAAWAANRLVPKVLVATQTRVIEAVVDEDGAWLPVTPVITVVPSEPGMLWHLAALLSSPVTCAHAASIAFGTSLSVDAIKLSAAQVRELAVPEPSAAWDDAAAALREASVCQRERPRRDALMRCGEAMLAAQGACADAVEWGRLLSWWAERLPCRSGRVESAPDAQAACEARASR